jgi:N-glycosyltransferase
MRVLLTGLPIQSHLVPVMVPVAKALREAGHEVAVATGAAMATQIEQHGIPVLVLADVLAPGEVKADQLAEDGVKFDLQKMREWRPETAGPLSVPLFNGVMAARAADNIVAVAQSWRPDLIVRETNEYGGYLAAEKLGIPLAVVDITPLITQMIPDLTDRLNVVRDGLGLPAIESFMHAYGQLTAGLLPEPWYPEALRSPRNHYYRLPDPIDHQPLDPAIAQLPSDAPLVLATFGSNLQMLMTADSKLTAITADALGSLPVRAVLALGSDAAVSSWAGPRPANVHFASFVQQRQLLGACDLFLTHAGFSGVRESLAVGVPMVALPLFSEQPVNATRVDELELGVEVNPAGITPETLAASLKRVLDDPSYRRAARGFQRQILGLPTLDVLVTDLEALG